MAESAPNYRDVPEEDRKAARKFFDYAQTVAASGQFDYSIELFIQGLDRDPEDVKEHQNLREISLKRKAGGGKDIGMMDRMKLGKPTKEDKPNMLNAEKLLAFDPGNTDRMVQVLQSAHRAGYFETVLWIGAILQKANADSKKPEVSKFIILKDIYKSIQRWDLASNAAQYAVKLDQDNMELQTELKNLATMDAMEKGKYGAAKSFRDSLRDADKQDRLLETDKDVRSADSLNRAVREAQEEWKADPNDMIKLNKLVDAMVRTEQAEYENQAIDLLDEAYKKTSQFRFRLKQGQIKMGQLARMNRSMREAVKANPNDAALQKEYLQFTRERIESELAEFQLALENYPTDTSFRYNVAVRLFELKRFDDAISAFQQLRTDPKFRVQAGTALGRSFLEAGFVGEAVDTLKTVIDEYPGKGDDRSKEMYYWYGRSLEKKGDDASARKVYSQLFQWESRFRDVQDRLKRLPATV